MSKLTLQREGRQMDRHLVGALEPLGQDILLQLQEELVPGRETVSRASAFWGRGGCRMGTQTRRGRGHPHNQKRQAEAFPVFSSSQNLVSIFVVV